MENFDEHIENEYRRRFDDFEEMPDDFLWKNIQARINPEKERPFIVWLNTLRGPVGIAASILIGLLIGVYFLIKTDNTPQISDLPNKPHTNTAQAQKPDVTQKVDTLESTTKSDSQIDIRDEARQLASTNAKKNQTTNEAITPKSQLKNLQLPVTNKKNNEAIAERKIESEKENGSVIAVNTPNPASKVAKSVITETNHSEKDKTGIANNTKNKVDEEDKGQNAEKEIDTKLAVKPLIEQPSSNTAIAGNTTTPQLTIIKDTLFQSINALSGKEAQNLVVSEKKLTAPDLPATEIPVIEVEERRRLVFIPPTEIFANVTSTLSYYMFSPNKGDQVLVENFSSRSQRVGFAAQLGFVYPIARKMDLRTGLSYFSGKSRISYGVMDNSQKSITVLNDNSIQIIPGTSTKNEFRNWQYFELQSDVLYEIRKMQALSLGMKVGVQTSAVNNPLLQARIGYRVSKAIAQHWALWLEPTVSVSLSSHQSLENLFMYRTTGLGLNMGVSLLR